ncbi:putative dentin sialophosphoprotein-like isoform X1 [Capsicum annuum]|nr:putative dentin sialophosphoprotein-like isoform X1 [Capsicum annuum]
MFDTTESSKERHSPLQHTSFILEMKLKALRTFSDIAVSTMAFIIEHFGAEMDLSPQDSTLLSDVVEVGTLPCLIRDNEDKRYCFYISTRYGLKYECSSISKIKVDSWLEALWSGCKL